MTKKALQFDACDNVAVALEAMNAGDSVIINGEGPEVKIVASPGAQICRQTHQVRRNGC